MRIFNAVMTTVTSSVGITSLCLVIKYLKSKPPWSQTIMDLFNKLFCWANILICLCNFGIIMLAATTSYGNVKSDAIKECLAISLYPVVHYTCVMNGIVQYLLIYNQDRIEKFTQRYSEEQITYGYVAFVTLTVGIVIIGNLITYLLGYEPGTTYVEYFYVVVPSTISFLTFATIKFRIWIRNDQTSNHLIKPKLVLLAVLGISVYSGYKLLTMEMPADIKDHDQDVAYIQLAHTTFCLHIVFGNESVRSFLRNRQNQMRENFRMMRQNNRVSPA